VDEGTQTTWYPDRDLDEYGDDADAFVNEDCSDPDRWQQTTTITAELVLDSETEVSTTLSSGSFDGSSDDWDDVLTEDQFTTTVAIWDEMGADHELLFAFERDSVSGWSWYGLVDGGELAGGTTGYPFELMSGTLEFDSDGSLQSFRGTSTTSTAPCNWANGARADLLELSLGLDASGATTDGSAMMAGAGSRVLDIHADGYPWLVTVGGDCDDGDPSVYPGQGC